MNESLIWDNLVTYSLQIGLLVGLAAFVPALLRLRLPGAKLAYWHMLLAACLVLPLVRPWQQEVGSGRCPGHQRVSAVQPSAPRRALDPVEPGRPGDAGGRHARSGWSGWPRASGDCGCSGATRGRSRPPPWKAPPSFASATTSPAR